MSKPKPILLVEAGAPSVNAAKRIAKNYQVISVHDADFETLKGRDVTIWLRPDEGGRKGAQALASKLIPNTGKRGSVQIVDYPVYLTECQLEQFMEAMGRVYSIIAPKVATVTVTDDAPALPADTRTLLESLGVSMGESGKPVVNLDNINRIMAGFPQLRGVFSFDEFYDRIYTTWNGPRRVLTDGDTLRFTIYLQREFGMQRASDAEVYKSIQVAAEAHTTNEPKEWMESLVWDGTARLDTFLINYMGAEDNPHTRAASRKWFISVVARTFKPGCKVDTMLILQGEQGRFKSTAFEILGGPWYAVATADAHDAKAFGEIMQGKMILELAELVSFSKSDAESIKRLLTISSDRYREAYGRIAQDRARRSVLVGTTNKTVFLQDVTGGRRFWPVWVERCDREGITRDRDQLFAEAVAAFRDGEDWWEMPEETQHAQENAREQDEWESHVSDWLEGKFEPVSGQQIWADVFNGKLEAFRKPEQHRIHSIMRAVGWEQKVVRDEITRKPRRMFVPKIPF